MINRQEQQCSATPAPQRAFACAINNLASRTVEDQSDDFSGAGIKIPGSTATSLKLFDLKTGEPKDSIATPGQATLCNDIVVASDGTAYVTDLFAGHILRLKPGAKEFEVWRTTRDGTSLASQS